jgi:hypothetical protein
MRPFSWIVLVVVAATLWGCNGYKPYLAEEFRGPAEDPPSNMPGLFTGRKGGYVIYER